MNDSLSQRRLVFLIAALLELVMIAEVAFSTRRLSATWDEGDHIFAGYMNWKHGEYDLNPEHPPLVKLVAALPLVPLDLKVPPRQSRFFKSESYYGGRELLFRNDPKYGGKYTADSLLLRAHLAVMMFSLLVAGLLFIAGYEMFSPAAGLTAMALWVFDPTVLTNAPLVTTDTGAALGIFAGVYTFYRFIKQMTWFRALVCGVACGVALVCKHNAVLLLPILLLLAVGEMAGCWFEQKRWPERTGARLLAGMAMIFAVSLTVLWSVYSFRFAMHTNGVAMPPLAVRMKPVSPLLQHIIAACARFHLLPESYLYGFADVVRVGSSMPTYVFGRLYAHGVWFYFPAILSLKWSEGVLGLLLLTAWLLLRGKLQQPREVFFLLLPALLYFATAIASPLNIGVRHVLPVFPFVFALLGAGAGWALTQGRAWRWAVLGLLAIHMASSLRMFPNYMPYANLFWGGPTRTHEFFSDSATEWGQDLKFAKQWTDEHHISECWIAHFPAPFLLPSDYGVPCKLLPTLDSMYEMEIALPPVVHGPLLVSFADLNGFEFGTKVRNPYQALFERKPDEVIANGYAVYNGDFALPEAAALRFIQHSRDKLKSNPTEALQAANKAVALVPRGFDENLVLGDALLALKRSDVAQEAYRVAYGRIADMEPSAQEHWRPVVQKKMQP